MTAKDLIDHYGAGSVHKAAIAAGVSHQSLYNWQESGVPALYQVWFERLTAGKLRADSAAIQPQGATQ